MTRRALTIHSVSDADPLATRLSGLLLTLGDDDANGEHREDLLHRSAAVLTAIGQSRAHRDLWASMR